MAARIIILVFLCGLFTPLLYSQKGTEEPIEVRYEKYENAALLEGDEHVLMYKNDVAFLSRSTEGESYFIDFKRQQSVQVLHTRDEDFAMISPFEEFEIPEKKDGRETILGYDCEKVLYDIFSNKVEVWYTKEAPAKGSPSFSFFPQDGLVLKYIVNGNYEVKAFSIEKNKEINFNYSLEGIRIIDQAEYRGKQIEARYITKNIFEKEQINFGDSIVNIPEEKLNHIYRYSKGTVILKKIELPEIKTGSSVFAKLTNWSNGDAYDRTGSIFTFTESNSKSILNAFKNGVETLPVWKANNGEDYQGIKLTEEFSPPIELMRFFTSFGVSHFNDKRVIAGYDWQDSAVYNQEITELIPSTQEFWIGVFIGNYDRGGHHVSLDLNFYPPWEEMAEQKKYIQALFNTLNVLEMSGQNYSSFFRDDTLSVDFELPENIENLQLRFTTTGHGGWGNGDEFTPRLNQVLIDDSLVFRHIPWRTDCSTYRNSNPSSGNFANGLSSSDLSRSNWCPATLTPPFYIPLDHLQSGKHSVRVVINQGPREGNSFNSWNVSGTLIGNLQNNKPN